MTKNTQKRPKKVLTRIKRLGNNLTLRKSNCTVGKGDKKAIKEWRKKLSFSRTTPKKWLIFCENRQETGKH